MLKDLKKDIDTKTFKRAYLLFGDEKFLVRFYEKKLAEAAAGAAGADMFAGKDHSPENIINAADSMPFFSERRAVLVKDSGLFAAGRKGDSEKIAAYAQNIPETTVVIFSEDDVDRRGKLYKTIAALESARAVEMTRPDDGELVKWIQSALKREGFAISPASAVYLLRYNGGGMDSLHAEIEKLAAYAAGRGGGEIAKADIEAVCVKSLETKIFSLVAAIGNKNPVVALDIFYNMVQTKESPIMVLTMMARQFRLILLCSHLSSLGLSSNAIAEKIGQKSFVIRECSEQGRNFSEKTLINALNDCLEADIAIKTGNMEDTLAVETLIIKYGSEKIANER